MWRRVIPSALAFTVAACAASGNASDEGAASDAATDGASGEADARGLDASAPDAPAALDTGTSDVALDGDDPLDPDAACATATAEAVETLRPVDIVWMVDNSASMRPAVDAVQAGLADFAALVAQKSLDYKVILLSLRGTTPRQVAGSTRYPVCIPEPLAGDAACGNSARFFHVDMDIKSTQPLEQLLGTLGQTLGYTPGTDRGGEPWRGELRAAATKTIVVVTDDDSRLPADTFEHFKGGKNPNNSSLVLPPGLLDASWGGLFDGYVMSAIYGYGSDTDPSVKCTYPDQSQPPKSGATYTALVQRTSGVRAAICDSASSATWTSFFDRVATAVADTSKIDCTLGIPATDAGTIDPKRVNVVLESGGQRTLLPQVSGASACASNTGWYYDDPSAPTKVTLCPAACDAANGVVGATKGGKVELLFGCASVVR